MKRTNKTHKPTSTSSKYFSKTTKYEKIFVGVDDGLSQTQEYQGSKLNCIKSSLQQDDLSALTKLKLKSFTFLDSKDVVLTTQSSGEDNQISVIDFSFAGSQKAGHLNASLVDDKASKSQDESSVHFTKLLEIDEKCEFRNNLAISFSDSSPVKQTQLQEQFLSIKNKYPTVLLFIECGYKFHLFGEDAEEAAKHLNISCYLYHNFKTASIPIQTLYVHVRRMVSKGFKVGIVKQIQTAALKSISDSRNSLFERELTAIYTKSTLIGEDIEKINSKHSSECNASLEYLLCLFEETIKTPHTVRFGVIAARPTTGDVMYSSFEDGKMRENLQQCLSLIQPVEIITSEVLTSESNQLLQHFSKTASEDVRMEFLPINLFSFDTAIDNVTNFVSMPPPSQLTKLPPTVICALSAMFEYLKDFGLQKVLQKLSCIKCLDISNNHFMKLSPMTKKNLDIFVNHSTGKTQESLFNIFDHTKTPFGRRFLKNWVLYPLKNQRDIIERQETVEKFIAALEYLLPLKKMLQTLPDLEYWLCAVYYHKSSCYQLYALLKSLNFVRATIIDFWSSSSSDLKTALLFLEIIMTRLEKISEYLSFLVEEAAKADDKTKLFNDVTLIYGYCELQLEIDHVLQELTSRKKLVSDVLGIPEFEYLTVNNIEYLIEVPLEKDNLVPISWRKMNMTKTTSRYRTPEIDDLVQKLSQLEEQKYNICLAYWKQFLEDFNSNFFAFKEVVDSLAKLDCYFSLAEFSTKDGYCKPNILHSTEICIDIVGGRHPLIEKYLPNDVEYIPNDLHLDSEKKGVIVTGPNMGGKSCFIKQVGIIALLAQIGSFVPAKNVSITPLDAIYVRMGSVDNIEENQSSFFVEAMETNNILSDVSRESLVLFDEFGCGTSTHDGMAIAYATLHHLLYKVKCFTLFVTHFMAITDLGLPSNSLAKNTHMTFMLNQADNEDVDQKVLFLYKLSNGTSKESYGMNVAKLVSIPEIIIKNAHAKSEIFKEAIEDRRKTRQLFKSIMQSNFPPNLRQLINFSK